MNYTTNSDIRCIKLPDERGTLPFSFKKILGYDSDKLQQQLIDETLNKSLLTKN